MSEAGKNDSKYKARWIYGVVVVASLLLILSGSWLETRFETAVLLKFIDLKLLGHMLVEAGIAGLIGCVLAWTIDRLSRDEFRKLAEDERNAIKTDVFYYVYGRDIPPAIRDEIDTQILKSDFVRLSHKLRFDLSIIDDPKTREHYVLSKCTSVYEVKNIAKVSRPLPLPHSIDRSPSPALADEVKYTSLSVKGCQSPFERTEDELRKMRTEDEDQVRLNFQEEIVVSPGQTCTVIASYHGIRNLKGGRIDFSFTTHTLALELNVEVPKRDLQVRARVFGPYELKKHDLHDPSNGHYHWRLEHPLLPYQTIYVMWSP
jgi:hypothetical protein